MCPISPATGFSLSKFNSWGNSWIQLRVGFSKETQEREREAKNGRVKAKMVRLKNDCRSGSMDRVRDLGGRGREGWSEKKKPESTFPRRGGAVPGHDTGQAVPRH